MPNEGVTNLRINGVVSITAPPGATLTLTWSPDANTYQTIARDSNGTMQNPTIVADNLDISVRTYDVTAPETDGEYYYFCIISHYPHGGNIYGNRVNVQAGAVIPATTPGNVALSDAKALPGQSVTMSWSASTAQDYVQVIGYEVAQSLSPDTVGDVIYTLDANTLQVTVDASSTAGQYYYYRVRAKANWSEGNSAWSAPLPLWAILPPAAATLNAGGTIYNPRPRVFAQTGTGEAPLSSSAPGMNISRTDGLGNNDTVLLQRVNIIPAGESAVISVTVADKFGISTSASVTVTRAVPVWTDDPIVAGVTIVKAAHINELRAALDAICDYYGIARTVWGETVEAGTTPLHNWMGHATELQNTVRRIAGIINDYDPESSANRVILPTMPTPGRASAEIINQLRQIVTML